MEDYIIYRPGFKWRVWGKFQMGNIPTCKMHFNPLPPIVAAFGYIHE